MTWNKCALMVGGLMALGIALALTTPVWLAPPYLFWTHVVYQFLALLWVPVLIICALLRPLGSKYGITRIALVGIPVLLWLSGSLVFNISSQLNPNTQFFQHCEQIDAQENTVLYECEFKFVSDEAVIVRFEGSKGSLFVRKIGDVR